MKKTITTIAVLLATGATQAQNFSYKIDSSFNGNGYQTNSIASIQQGYAGIGACKLYNDGKMYLSSHFISQATGSTYPNVENFLTKRKANGSIDSSFSNDGVTGLQVVGTTAAWNTELFGIQNNGLYIVNHATWGGACTNNIADTGITKQFYNSLSYANQYSHSIQANDSIIITSFGSEINAYQNNFANAYTSTNYFSDVNTSVGGNISTKWGQIFPIIATGEIPLYFKLGIDKNERLIIGASNWNSGTNTYSGTHLIRLKRKTLTDVDSTFGTNGIITLQNSFPIQQIDWRQGIICGIKSLSNNAIIVAFHDFSSNNYKLIKIGTSGSIDNSFGTNGAITFNSYLYNINIDAQDNILVSHDSTIVEAFTSAGQAKNIVGNSNKLLFSVPGFSDLQLVNSSMNNNGDLLICGYKNGTVYSQNLSGYGTDAIVIKAKRITAIPSAIAEKFVSMQQLPIYPNPAASIIHIGTAQDKVQIFNLQGQSLINTNGGEINIMHLAAGVYVAKVNNVTTRFTKL
jgi:Secretion system C-terminal sorting domain